MRTETVAGDRHPRFTTRAYFSPLTMKNSQNHAMNTTVRIDAYFKETMFASKQVNLAQLLWSMAYETRIESPYPPRMSSYSGNVCKIRLNLLKGRSAEEDVDDSEVVFIIQMKRSVWTKARDSKLFMTVSSVAGYGQWSRCYVSELLTIPTKTMNTRRFSSFKLNRGDLIGNSLQNPFRVEILGTKKGISTVHGFIQIPLPSASRQRYVSWNQSISSYLKANVILHATVAPPNRVSLSFHIGTDGDADEVCTNTERHENVTGGNGKLRKTWDAVMAQTNRSYQSLRSSSGSSDSSEVSSPDKRRGKTHPAGPQYHVRFPTFG